MYVTTIVQLELAAVSAVAVAFALRETGDVTVSDTALAGCCVRGVVGGGVGGGVGAVVGGAVGATVGCKVGNAVGAIVGANVSVGAAAVGAAVVAVETAVPEADDAVVGVGAAELRTSVRVAAPSRAAGDAAPGDADGDFGLTIP